MPTRREEGASLLMTRKAPDPKLVERVARAIFRAANRHDAFRSRWSEYAEETHEHYRAMARAAIKAMGR